MIHQKKIISLRKLSFIFSVVVLLGFVFFPASKVNAAGCSAAAHHTIVGIPDEIKDNVAVTVSGCEAPFRNLEVDVGASHSRSAKTIGGVLEWDDSNNNGIKGEWRNYDSAGIDINVAQSFINILSWEYLQDNLVGAVLPPSGGGFFPLGFLLNSRSGTVDHFNGSLAPWGNHSIDTSSSFSGEYVCSSKPTPMPPSCTDGTWLPGSSMYISYCHAGVTEDIAYFGPGDPPYPGANYFTLTPALTTTCYSRPNPGNADYYDSGCIPHSTGQTSTNIVCTDPDTGTITTIPVILGGDTTPSPAPTLPQNTLNVQARKNGSAIPAGVPVSQVSLVPTIVPTGVPSGVSDFSGTADYIRTVKDNFSVVLRVPRTLTAGQGGGTFSSWTGCDTSSSSLSDTTMDQCSVSMSMDAGADKSKTIIANYSGSALPTVDLYVTYSAVDYLKNTAGGTMNVSYGATPVLKWTSTNATSCTGTGFSTGAGNPVNNTTGVTVGPLAATPNSYSISCTGPGGSASDLVTVNVNAPTLSCSGVLSGTTGTWTAVPVPATAPTGSTYSYTWAGTNIPTGASTPTANPYSISYATSGAKTASATLTATGQSPVTANCPSSLSPLPDLTPADPPNKPLINGDTADITLKLGTSFTLAGQPKNIGTETSGSFQVKFQRKVHGTADTTYVDMFTKPTITGLAAGETKTTSDITLSGSTAGTYDYRYCVDIPPDNPGAIPESNEENNCSGPVVLTLVDGSFSCAPSSTSTSLPWTQTNGTNVSIFRGNTLVQTVAGASGTVADTGLTPSTSYTYYLRNGATASSLLLSSVTCATTAASLATPTITVAEPGLCGAKVRLTWDPVAGATGYRVYRSTTLSGTYSEITGPAPAVGYLYAGAPVDYTDISGLSTGVVYYYKVSAYSGTAASPSSGSRSGTASDLCPDLVVDSVTSTVGGVAVSQIVDGDSIRFSAVVRNQGGATPTTFQNQFALDGNTALPLYRFPLNGLGGGLSTSILMSSLDAWTAVAGSHSLAVCADNPLTSTGWGSVFEENAANNAETNNCTTLPFTVLPKLSATLEAGKSDGTSYGSFVIVNYEDAANLRWTLGGNPSTCSGTVGTGESSGWTTVKSSQSYTVTGNPLTTPIFKNVPVNALLVNYKLDCNR